MNVRIAVLIGIVAASCSGASPEVPATTTTMSAVTTTSAPTTDEICRIGDLRFTDAGLVGAVGEEVGDATTLTEVRWDDSATCERITLVFASDSGAPAGRLGQAAATIFPSTGMVHVALPLDISTTAIADTLPEGDYAERIYAVRNNDGFLSIDVHAPEGQAIAARVFTTESPATLVIDLIPTETVLAPVGAEASPTVVLVTPPSGPTIYPYTIEGYAAPGAQGLTIQLTQDTTTVVDRTLSLPGWTDAWQTISTPITDGPSGTVNLFVGNLTEEGLRGVGVEVTLDLP